jgi:N utilization substance protein A
VTIQEEEITLERRTRPQALMQNCGQWVDIYLHTSSISAVLLPKQLDKSSRKNFRSAERDVIYEEYRHRVNELISGSG